MEEDGPVAPATQVSSCRKRKKSSYERTNGQNEKSRKIGLFDANRNNSFPSQDSSSRTLQAVVMGIRTRERPAGEFSKILSCKKRKKMVNNCKTAVSLGLDH